MQNPNRQMSLPLPEPRFADNDRTLPADARANWIAVLPLGAHEQHGPHLPFETDSLIAAGVVERLITARPATLPVTFLPVERIGYSIEHMDVPGTRTLSFAQAINRWLAIAEGLAEQGIRKFVMLKRPWWQFTTDDRGCNRSAGAVQHAGSCHKLDPFRPAGRMDSP